MIGRPPPTIATSPLPSSGAGTSSRPTDAGSAETPLGSPLAFGVTVLSLAFLAAGIFWPQGASALIRILVATLALGYVASRLYRAELPERTTHDAYAPFDGRGGGPRPAVPEAIRSLAAQLESAVDGSGSGSPSNAPIPWPIGRSLIREASRLLAERHGLRLREPGHHSAIRALVSEPTWLLIDPRGSGLDGAALETVEYRAVPMGRLDEILEDLERL